MVSSLLLKSGMEIGVHLPWPHKSNAVGSENTPLSDFQSEECYDQRAVFPMNKKGGAGQEACQVFPTAFQTLESPGASSHALLIPAAACPLCLWLQQPLTPRSHVSTAKPKVSPSASTSWPGHPTGTPISACLPQPSPLSRTCSARLLHC